MLLYMNGNAIQFKRIELNDEMNSKYNQTNEIQSCLVVSNYNSTN